MNFRENKGNSSISFECFGYQNDIVLITSNPNTVKEIRNLTGMSQILTEWYVSDRVIPTTDLL